MELERARKLIHEGIFDHSHAPRGNAAGDALRPAVGDAERHGMHSHAERGNEQQHPARRLAGNPLGSGGRRSAVLSSGLKLADRHWRSGSRTFSS